MCLFLFYPLTILLDLPVVFGISFFHYLRDRYLFILSLNILLFSHIIYNFYVII